MIPARSTKGALRAINHVRSFSVVTAQAAKAPSRPTVAASQPASKREQTTATPAEAPQTRPVPAPAFNQQNYRDVQPLQPYRPQELDHSFIGMTGGEIFHEMMLRQGVKHICK